MYGCCCWAKGWEWELLEEDGDWWVGRRVGETGTEKLVTGNITCWTDEGWALTGCRGCCWEGEGKLTVDLPRVEDFSKSDTASCCKAANCRSASRESPPDDVWSGAFAETGEGLVTFVTIWDWLLFGETASIACCNNCCSIKCSCSSDDSW